MPKCRECGNKFERVRPLQPTCLNFECQLSYARKIAEKSAINRAKEEKREFAKKKEKIKRTSDIKREAQAAFNAWVRFRDSQAGHPCICCGKPFEPSRPGGSIDAGHYLSRGSHPNLAFDERNVHAQRKNCNRPGGTTAAAFRIGMIARIGLEAVEALEEDTEPKRYRADDYRRIRDEYRERLRLAKKAAKVESG